MHVNEDMLAAVRVQSLAEIRPAAEALRDAIRTRRRDYFDGVKALIIEGVESGRFRAVDPVITTYGFLGMCNWAYKWYPPMAKTRTPEEVADALCGPFFDGLKAG